MKKKFLLILFCVLSPLLLIASSIDSISTTYKDGQFTTYSQVFVNASDSTCSIVTKDYDYQMRYNLDALFPWALKGMNLRKEKKELMMFFFKSTSFNKESSVLRGIGDVIIPGVITFPNIYVDCKLTSKPTINGNSTVYLNLLSSNGFIKNMNNSFSVIPVANKKGNWFILVTNVRFGWFFNIFITEKRFKSIMEWRLKQFIHNLKNEAERRVKIPSTNKKLINYTIQHKNG